MYRDTTDRWAQIASLAAETPRQDSIRIFCHFAPAESHVPLLGAVGGADIGLSRSRPALASLVVQKTMSNRPRVPPASILRCASAACSGGNVSATRSVSCPPRRGRPGARAPRDCARRRSPAPARSDAALRRAREAAHGGELAAVANRGRTAASSTAASISPSTPPGAASCRPRTMPRRGAPRLRPKTLHQRRVADPATAITRSPSATPSSTA